MYYIGIDLGTSSLKLLLADEAGEILNTVSKDYPLEFPKPGWSQQAPEDWHNAVMEAFRSCWKVLTASRWLASALVVRCTALWCWMRRIV